jgi:hypothetical protein
VLRREPEKRGLRWREPARWVCRWWRRGELELGHGCGIEQSEAPMASSNQRARGGEREWEMEGGGVGSVPHGGREMGERERAPCAAVGSVG